MNKQASVSDIVKILDHDRAVVTWVVRPILNPDGTPGIERLTRIAVIYPKDGAGRLRMAITDWGLDSAHHGRHPLHFVTSCTGFGYDKLTAAIEGCTIGGVEVGDHCDSAGRPTAAELCRREGWHVFGDAVRSF